MSRFYENECDDVYGLLAAGRFTANERRVFKSKRGKKFLQELEDALLRIPTRELIDNSLCEYKTELFDYGEGPVEVQVPQFCALGAWMYSKGEKPESLVGLDTQYDSTDIAENLGMTFTMAWIIGYTNDEFRYATPKDRWLKLYEKTKKAQETGVWPY